MDDRYPHFEYTVTEKNVGVPEISRFDRMAAGGAIPEDDQPAPEREEAAGGYTQLDPSLFHACDVASAFIDVTPAAEGLQLGFSQSDDEPDLTEGDPALCLGVSQTQLNDTIASSETGNNKRMYDCVETRGEFSSRKDEVDSLFIGVSQTQPNRSHENDATSPDNDSNSRSSIHLQIAPSLPLEESNLAIIQKEAAWVESKNLYRTSDGDAIPSIPSLEISPLAALAAREKAIAEKEKQLADREARIIEMERNLNQPSENVSQGSVSLAAECLVRLAKDKSVSDRTESTNGVLNSNSIQRSKGTSFELNSNDDTRTKALHVALSDLNIPPSIYSAEYAASMKWSKLWKHLHNAGWRWAKGKGLVDFFYLAPNTTIETGIEGETLFTSTEAVREFIALRLATLESLSPGDEDKSPSISDEEEQWEEERRDNDRSADTSANDNSDILTIPWCDLWAELTASEGWHWDFGSGLISTLYMLPGVTKSTGVLGFNMFGCEEEVRLYVAKQRGIKPQDTVPLKPSTIAPEELEDWNLIKHRKRRTTTSSASSPSPVKRKPKRSLAAKSSAREDKRKHLSINDYTSDDDMTQQQHFGASPSSPRDSSGRKMTVTPKHRHVSTNLASPAASQFAAASALQRSLVCSSSKNGNNTKIFGSLAFLVTGISEENVRVNLEKQLTENGGVVIPSDLSLADLRDEVSRYTNCNSSAMISAAPRKSCSRSIVALSIPNGCRRPKYILCLALRLPLLHYSWAFDSIAHMQLAAVENYVLPSGSSPLCPYYLFSNFVSHPRSLFVGIRVVNYANDVWRELLLSAGATVLLAGGNTTSADYFLVDALDYTEEKLTREALSVIRLASSVVTVDWFVYCLQTNQLTDPCVCPSIFLLPPDPIRHPTTIKTQSSMRYTIHDVVSYKNSGSNTSGIGLIRTFSRKDRKPKSSVLIKLTPLRIVSNCEKLQQLTPRVNMDILISSEWLTGRLIVLSQEAATMVNYGKYQKDESVFVSSIEWETSEEANKRADGEEKETSNKRCHIQMSQDY